MNNLYRKLLSPPVVPAYEHVAVGIAKSPTLDDLAEIMPVGYKTFSKLAMRVDYFKYLIKFHLKMNKIIKFLFLYPKNK